MLRDAVAKGFGSLRRALSRWRKTAATVGGLVLLEVGARIGLPGVDGAVLAEYFRRGVGGLLWLYDRFVGGALSRGAILALGVMPYLSARIMMRLARETFPPIAALSSDAEGRRRLRRWTRFLTVGLAVAQGGGFARFVQSIPGAVAHPGAGFVIQTILVLTTGAVAVMRMAEWIATSADADESVQIDTTRTSAPSLEQSADAGLALPPAPYDEAHVYQSPRRAIDEKVR